MEGFALSSEEADDATDGGNEARRAAAALEADAADDDDDDIYAEIDKPTAPSQITLRAELERAEVEVAELRARLAELDRAIADERPKLERAVRDACVMLSTARHEVKRKQQRVDERRRSSRRR